VERLLADPLFSQSKRYGLFLRYVTERAINNIQGHVTERSLGVEIFERSPNYDTDADPIVRVTASEVRKRLAQYYEDPAHSSELRLLIHKGSYAAEFVPPGPEHPPADVFVTRTALVVPAPPLAPAPTKEPSTKRRWYYISGVVGICIVVAAILWVARPRASAFDLFWKPLMDGSHDVLVSIPQISDHVHLASAEDPQLSWSDSLTPIPDPMRLSWTQYATRLVHVRDLSTACRLSEFFGSKGKHVIVKGEHVVTMGDLRETPAVILGGLNNQWTGRLVQHARFFFDGEGTVRFIRDSQNPTSRRWSYDAKVPTGSRDKDLIIISRVSDSVSGRVTVLAGGFSAWGTEAAVSLLTNPDQMQTVLAQAPRKWDARNVQITLECTVVNAQAGIPRFLAAHSW